MNVKQAISTFIDYQKLNSGKKYGKYLIVKVSVLSIFRATPFWHKLNEPGNLPVKYTYQNHVDKIDGI